MNKLGQIQEKLGPILIESLPNIIEHNYLGLTLTGNGQWHCLIENMIKSASNVFSEAW